MVRKIQIGIYAATFLLTGITAASADPISAAIISAAGLAAGGFGAAVVTFAVNLAIATPAGSSMRIE